MYHTYNIPEKHQHVYQTVFAIYKADLFDAVKELKDLGMGQVRNATFKISF